MANKRGRKNKYHTHVEPYLTQVSEMALTMTEQQISTTLGVSYTAFREYKRQYPALKDSLKKGRRELVKELKSVLIQKAKGFEYKESKTIIEEGTVIREEIYQKRALPDVAALNLLLKNYDKDNWANDPQMLALKREELEFRKEQLTADEW